ncbi:MAG: ADP-ribosylglycohydrolase family protein, partial [Bacteroidetes bacterium]|nr:ADP-ribosylglycohydrolase family protein [Bacteroidota bacterium]
HDYRDRVQAVWMAQMLGAMMGWPFEHKVASTEWIHTLKPEVKHAPVDDDWYYEMVAVRAFEKYGTDMSVEQLGRQWMENAAGSWGSSEQARLLMNKGIMPPDCGHPRYNKLWFTIGPQFSSDVYGALAPGRPNLAAAIARKYGHINGYAEGLDGGVFVAGLVSLGFTEKDPKAIVRKAARLINAASPYRQCLDEVIQMADKGGTPAAIFDQVERRWHMEYPATNNAVANGGIVAASLWFGEGDFLKTINLAFGAADFTDADCNAANAAAVIGAMHGMKALPAALVQALRDSIIGDKMGKVILTPAVHETISGLAARTAAIGEKLLRKNGSSISNDYIRLLAEEPAEQPAELFRLSDLMQYWNPGWTLGRAGFGGAGGGMPGIRGITYLDGDVLATYPRDEVKGVVLSRAIRLTGPTTLSFDAGVDSQRVWQCVVFANNRKLFDRLMEGTKESRSWTPVKIDLATYKDSTVTIRIYQRVLVTGRTAGNAYWRNLRLE